MKGKHWKATSDHQPFAFVMAVNVKSVFTCIRIPQKIHIIDTGLPVKMGWQKRLISLKSVLLAKIVDIE